MFPRCHVWSSWLTRMKIGVLLALWAMVALPIDAEVRAEGLSSSSAALTLIADPALKKADPSLPAVVFIPGLASDPAVFDAAAQRLREAGLVIWRARIAGFAGAPAVAGAARADLRTTAARTLLAALAEREIPRAVLVGHSFGGQIAMVAAAKGDERIAGIVIVDTVPFLAGLFNPQASPDSARQQAAAFAAQLAAMPEADAKAMLVRQQTMLTRTADFRTQLADWTQRSDLATIIAASRQALGDDLRPLIPRIGVPALILFAHDSAMGLPVDMLRRVYESQYRALPRHRITVIEDSFHFIPVDQPAAFAQAVREFVGELAAGTAKIGAAPAVNAVAQQ